MRPKVERIRAKEGEMQAIRRLVDWLCLRDYERAKHQGTVDVIARLSRGNTLSQNGAVLTEEDLTAMSKAADKDMARLEKMIGAR